MLNIALAIEWDRCKLYDFSCWILEAEITIIIKLSYIYGVDRFYCMEATNVSKTQTTQTTNTMFVVCYS